MRVFFSNRKVRLALVALGAVVVGLALVLGCGGGKSTPVGPSITTVPTAWGGIWTSTMTMKLCQTSQQLSSTTEVDTICAGKPIEQTFSMSDAGCTGGTFTATATSVGFSCSQVTTLEGCTGNMTVTMNITINAAAGTMTGSGRLTFHPTSGTNCPPADLCVDITLSGTRTSTAQPGCSSSKPAMLHGLWPSLESTLRQRSGS